VNFLLLVGLNFEKSFGGMEINGINLALDYFSVVISWNNICQHKN